MNASKPHSADPYGPQRLSIELVDICNLHCSYCLRDDDALYGHKPNFLSLTLLERVLPEACAAMALTRLTFTGGEPSLHPQFSEILDLTAQNGLKASFVTNGWNFERIWPAVSAAKEWITHVAFSIDGVTAADHDYWRGAGSFRRLVSGFSYCHKGGIPFVLKATIRRDTVAKLEQLALFAARMGADALSFSHILPTGPNIERELTLDRDERDRAELEIATLAQIFKMKINIDVGYHNLDAAAPCSPLAGTSCNVDYRGRLTLCCNLSGFRDSADVADIVGDLNVESFESAYIRLRALAEAQIQRRAKAINEFYESSLPVDLFVGSPCLFCLQTFGKIPWRTGTSADTQSRSLPVFLLSASK
jgi:MoaA/NifB/PqqE/SkfB family radical SAM enzyme